MDGFKEMTPCTNIYHRLPFFEGYVDFVDFGDFHKICFTKNQQKLYRDTDCRLKRKHQCRFMKMVSSNFSFTKFVALEKRRPTVKLYEIPVVIILEKELNYLHAILYLVYGSTFG